MYCNSETEIECKNVYDTYLNIVQIELQYKREGNM